MSELAFFIDYSRCIACQACVPAVAECDTPRGRPLIPLGTIHPRASVPPPPRVAPPPEAPTVPPATLRST